ncbi:cytochrome P450 [Planomonospora parontospora]|uniref:cytochrome P450 n=1 Tax=Planomonospora parontospora TaxID=58119 RepID=UPI001670AA37|nr:cytochrome P450 [Planomonospora parontospora]GGL21448.1 cytochrome P450 [Planomonospora parontospora subsp. antibiotica]GII15785.1 cytochrome P450 [Planomonospora parontospora subsp. antibiotica]
MTAVTNPAASACPIRQHPLDRDSEGVNRPGLYLNPEYERIRDETDTGVVDVTRSNGTPAKLVTRYDDVMKVLRDPVFSREKALPVDDVVGLEGTLLGLDGAAHAAVRGLVIDHFTPRAVEARRAEIERCAAAQLQTMIDGGAPADLLADFAMPFVLELICDLLGLPEADRADFHRWSAAFLSHTSLSPEEAQASGLAMFGYLTTLLARRRSEPDGDLLSRIAVDGAHLPEQHLIMLPIALIVGGWETSASSIGTFIQVLLTHPYGGYDSAYRYLVDHPDEVVGAVTELERMFTTAAADAMPRYVTADITLPSGARLKEGEIVIPSTDAANYDPRAFTDPKTMDFTRFTRAGTAVERHLSFGYGIHHCIGRHLGHAEVVTAIALLLRELPTLRLAVDAADIPRKIGHAVAGPTRLPVAWR